MRDELKPRNGLRGSFTATFSRYGVKTGWRGARLRTVLLVDVRDAGGKLVTDHLWFMECMGFKRLTLGGGERIAFEARVTPYVKGYFGRNEARREEAPPTADYKLSWPKNIRIQAFRVEAPELVLEAS